MKSLGLKSLVLSAVALLLAALGFLLFQPTHVTTGGQSASPQNAFPEGVLAINTDQSAYQLGQTASLQMGVVDSKGNTTCLADLSLKITSPSGKLFFFSTNDGTIKTSGECVPNTVIDSADYVSSFTPKETGTYRMQLTNVASGLSAESLFAVSNQLPLLVQRIAATRINPMHDYVMSIKLSASEDFSGKVIETAPAEFQIIDTTDGGEVKTNASGGQEIVWQVALKKQGTIILAYTYRAPLKSPEFYALGPLAITTGQSTLFKESRQWQVASDVTVTVFLTASGTWSLPGDFTAPATITAIGGGGGGGGGTAAAAAANNNAGSGGGGGGAGGSASISFTPPNGVNNFAYTVGAAGTGGAAGGAGNPGTNTSFNNGAGIVLNAPFGSGGNNGVVKSNGGTGGAGGTGGTGTTLLNGGAGGAGQIYAGARNRTGGGGGGGGGAGGTTAVGNVGNDPVTTSNTTRAVGGTGGAGGAANGGTGGAAGGAGNPGTAWNNGAANAGAGGGGGGGNGVANAGGDVGGQGGAYGAGGAGGAGAGANLSATAGGGGAGTPGIIVITYTQAVVAAPTVTTDSAESFTSTSATLFGSITDIGGATPTTRGFAISTDSALTSGVSTTTENGSFGTGSFNVSSTTLSVGQTYYYRAYAYNGSYGCGSILNFTTGNSTPARRMRLFEGYKIKFISGTLKVNQQ